MSSQNHVLVHQNDGSPRGTFTTLHGLYTYTVGPPEGKQAKGVIILIPDAFGLGVRSKLLADAYATKGNYIVYLPDFMLGQCACENPCQGRTYADEMFTGHSCPSWFLDTMKALMAPGNYLMKP